LAKLLASKQKKLSLLGKTFAYWQNLYLLANLFILRLNFFLFLAKFLPLNKTFISSWQKNYIFLAKLLFLNKIFLLMN
jgi:hypothetical protein